MPALRNIALIVATATAAIAAIESHAAAPLAAPSTMSSLDGASLDAVSFLSGTWRGTMGDDTVEVFWSEPAGDSIVGTFRWLAGGERTQLVELLTITEHDDGVVMHLRHFDAALVPWPSEKDPVTFRLADHGGGRAAFESTGEQRVDSITYARDGSSLSATIAFAESSGRDPLVLRFARVN